MEDINMNDEDREIKELKERLNKLENRQSVGKEKTKEKDKPGMLTNIMTVFLLLFLLVWLFGGGSESPPSDESANVEIEATPKVDVNDQYRSIVIESLKQQNIQSYWGQDTSLWIENPGWSKSELERFGYRHCDATKSSGMKQSYIITFWQSLTNGPKGQIIKVKCF
jgi:hypothetical protein